ncbi:hypothetical protein [Lactobacillus delbrueckii]|uniref:hypothetical protein n=1 Tax=Lactobacillus delbrueckii TaxID=1584 RepID=UPI003993C9DE
MIFRIRRKALELNDDSLNIAKRLMMVATAEYYGTYLAKSEYGSAFDDLIRYRLVTTDDSDTFVLTKRGVKVANRISTEIYHALCHA